MCIVSNSLVCLALIVISTTTINGELDYDGRVNIALEHSFDSNPEPQYTFRGEIGVKSLHSGSVFLEQAHLNQAQIDQLYQLVNKNSFYRLRATVRNQDGKESKFHTFTQACSLVESNLSDIISVHLDHVGNTVGVSLSSPVTCSGVKVHADNLRIFNTTVLVQHVELGPVPDTASYIQKIEKEREAKERGETKDNRSFLSKYWMYIVPLIIFMMLAGGPNADAAGQR